MVVDDDDASFKKPGAVPFKWEIRPGVPKIRPGDDRTLLQPPKKLTPLKFKPSPPSSSSSSPSSSSEFKSRPVSPFAPPPSFKPSPDFESHSSGPPSPYFRSSTPRASGGVLQPSLSSSVISECKNRSVSPFAPPSFKPKQSRDCESHFSGPLNPYFRSSTPRVHGGVWPPSNSPSPSSSSSSSSSVISEYKSRPVSPFAPPPSFKPSPDYESHSSGPPIPYFKSSTPRAHSGVLPKLFPKSFFGMKKSKSGELKKTAHESSSSSSSSEFDNFRKSRSEDSSSGGSSSSKYSSNSSFSSHRNSRMKRIESDLSSYEKKTLSMMDRSRLG